MIEIQFELDQVKTIIHSKLEEPFKNIIDKYLIKISKEPDTLYFISNDKQMNPNETIGNQMNEQEKKDKKIIIYALSTEKENKNDIIIKSKDIICLKCKEPCRIIIENYKIKLYECPKDIICLKCKEPCRIIIENYKIKLYECPNGHINDKNLKNLDIINNKNEIYKILKDINNNNIKDQLNYILNIYNNIIDNNEIIINNKENKLLNKDINNNKKNEMTIIYNNNKENKIKIFDNDFIKNNKDKCYIVIDNKKTELKEYIDNNNKNKIEIKLYETGIITNMGFMFYGCNSLNSLPDISKWDTKNVTAMNSMFSGCNSLNSLPDISKWVLNSNLSKYNMFDGVNKKIIPKKFK